MLRPALNSTQKNIITVVLSNVDEDIEKDFRCVVCGKICFQYRSSVELIIPGNAPIVRPPKIFMCLRSVPVTLPDGRTVETKCKTRYYIIG